MSSSLGTLSLDLIAKVGGFTAPLDRADRVMRQTTRNIDRNLQDMQRQMDRAANTFKAMAATIGVGLSVNAFKNWTLGAAQAAEQTKFFADRIGLTTEELTKLQFVGSQFNVSADALNTAMQRFQRRAGEAANGFGVASKAFKDLNLEAREVISLPIDQQFKKIAEALRGIDDQGMRMNVVKNLFDTGGMPLLNMLNASGEEFDDLIDKAERLGYVTSTEFANMSADVLGEISNIRGAFSNVGKEIAVDFLEPIDAFLKSLTTEDIERWVNNFRKTIDVGVVALKGLAVIIAGRMVASLYASGKAFRANSIEVTRNTAALIAQGQGAKVVTSSHIAMAKSARVLSLAMAPFGGGVGLLATAGFGLYSLGSAMRKTAVDAEETSNKIDELAQSLESFSTKGKSAVELRVDKNNFEKGIQEVRKELKALETEAGMASINLRDAKWALNQAKQAKETAGVIQEIEVRVKKWSVALDDANVKIEKANALIGETYNQIDSIGNAQNSNAVVLSDEFEKQSKHLKDRYHMIGLTTEAEKVEMQIQQGIIKLEGDNAELEKERLITQAKMVDEKEKSVRLEQELTRAIENSMRAMDSQMSSLRERVRTVGMTGAQQEIVKLSQQNAEWAQQQIKAGRDSNEVYQEANSLLTKQVNEIKRSYAHIDKINTASKATTKTLKASNKELSEYASLVKQLQTDEERRLSTLQEQLEIINKAKISETERLEMSTRAANAAMKDIEAPDLGVIGGDQILTQMDRLNIAKQELDKWYQDRQEMLEQFRETQYELNEVWDEKERELKEMHQTKMDQIERAKQNTVLDGVSEFLGSIQALKDSHDIRARNAAKAAAIVDTTISTFKAAQLAFESQIAIPIIGPALAKAQAAAAIVAGMARVQQIRGMAHDGIDAIPETGTWLLEKNERVVTAKTSKRLDDTLASIQQNLHGMGGGNISRSTSVNQTINVNGRVDNRTARQIARETAREQYIAEARFGNAYK